MDNTFYATFLTEKIVQHRYVTGEVGTNVTGGEGGHNRQKLALRRPNC
jgi:hypothetical protein